MARTLALLYDAKAEVHYAKVQSAHHYLTVQKHLVNACQEKKQCVSAY